MIPITRCWVAVLAVLHVDPVRVVEVHLHSMLVSVAREDVVAIPHPPKHAVVRGPVIVRHLHSRVGAIAGIGVRGRLVARVKEWPVAIVADANVARR